MIKQTKIGGELIFIEYLIFSRQHVYIELGKIHMKIQHITLSCSHLGQCIEPAPWHRSLTICLYQFPEVVIIKHLKLSGLK